MPRNAQAKRQPKPQPKPAKRRSRKEQPARRRPKKARTQRRRQGGSLTVTTRAVSRPQVRLAAGFPTARVVEGRLVCPGRFLPMSRSGTLFTPMPRRERLRRLMEIHAKDSKIMAELTHLSAMASMPAALPTTLASASAAAAGTGLSDCAALLAKAVANPFGTFDELPCLPCTPPVESQRWKSLVRGVCSTGTEDVGFLCVAPYVSSYNVTKVYSTDGTYARTDNQTMGLYAGVVETLDSQLGFPNSVFGTGMQSRLVALGIRWRNISVADEIGGDAAAIQVDDALNFTGFTPLQVMKAPSAVVIENFRRPEMTGESQNTWFTMLWRPQDMASIQFQPAAIGGSVNTNATIFIVFNAPSGHPQTFEWEMVSFYEYTGIAESGGVITNPASLSVSHADTVGVDRVLEAVQRQPLDLTAESWAEQMAVGIVDAVAHSDTAARTTEALTGGDGMGLGKVIGMANSLLGFLLA